MSEETTATTAEPVLEQTPEETTEKAGRKRFGLGRRRRFLVDPKQQFRTALMIIGVVLIPLVLMNMLAFTLRSSATQALLDLAPERAAQIEVTSHIQTFQLASLSVMLLLIVAMGALYETHKTAGAAKKLRGELEKVGEGILTPTVTLRKGDTLHALAASFNRMVRGLEKQAEEEAEKLDGLAQRLEGSEDDEARKAIRYELRELAREKRARIVER